MSWGATAFTPIITRNEPPFGFAELPTMPDFKTCNENPWQTGERVKSEIQEKLLVDEYRRSLTKSQTELPFNYDKAKDLKCVEKACDDIYENFQSDIEFNIKGLDFVLLLLLIAIVWYCVKK